MDDAKKRLFDTVFALRTAAWNSSHTRREFEWRAALALWSALGAMIGILLTAKDATIGPYIKIGGTGLAIVLIVAHASFTRGLQEANRYDRDLADHYDDFIEDEFLKRDCPTLVENPGWRALKKRRESRRGTTILTNYSHRFQAGVTALLGFCLIGLLLSR